MITFSIGHFLSHLCLWVLVFLLLYFGAGLPPARARGRNPFALHADFLETFFLCVRLRCPSLHLLRPGLEALPLLAVLRPNGMTYLEVLMVFALCLGG